MNVTAGGTGFSGPDVGISGGGGSGATAVATITTGVITAITVTNPGSGYATAPAVNITGGVGNGATATATLVGGGVGSIAVTAGGSGYVEPTVTFRRTRQRRRRSCVGLVGGSSHRNHGHRPRHRLHNAAVRDRLSDRRLRRPGRSELRAHPAATGEGHRRAVRHRLRPHERRPRHRPGQRRRLDRDRDSLLLRRRADRLPPRLVERHPDRRAQRRHADLESRPSGRRHARDPLPPVQRAGHQPRGDRRHRSRRPTPTSSVGRRPCA